MNNKGMIHWKKNYGENLHLFFQSRPLFSNKKIFLSSLNNQILVLDSENGEELERITTRMSIIYNYTMLQDKNLMYIPLSDGVYTYSLHENIFHSTPLIQFNSPAGPVFTLTMKVLDDRNKKVIFRKEKSVNHGFYVPEILKQIITELLYGTGPYHRTLPASAMDHKTIS